MPSTFYGLGIGTSGLYAAQTALNVTGNNIANERTNGYTRQVASQRQTQPLRTYSTAGTLGSGVEVYEISQVRDDYYDIKFWNNSAKESDYETKLNYYQQVEYYFNEINVEGFSTEFSAVFNSLEELENDPADLTVRNQFLNNLASVADYINNISGELTKLRDEINTEVSNTIDAINSLTDQIATLTKQINIIELEGTHANDLRDKRALLVDDLSKLLEVDVTETIYENGKSDYIVTSASFPLVNSYERNQLVIKADDEGNYFSYIFYDPVSGNATEFNPVKQNNDGKLKSLFELRDGNNGVTSYRIRESLEESEVTTKTKDGITYNGFTLGDGSVSGGYTLEDQSYVRVLRDDGSYGTTIYAKTYKEDSAGAYEPAADAIHYIYETGEYVFGSDILAALQSECSAGGKLEISYTVAGEDAALSEAAEKTGVLGDLAIKENPALNYKGVGYYIDELQSLKTILMMEFNSYHHQGVDLNGNSTLTVDIYCMDNANNLYVNEELLKDRTLMATSSNKPQDGVGDSNLVKMMQGIEESKVFKGGTCSEFLESLTTEISMDVKKINSRHSTYSSLGKTIKNQRLSVSGVDTDEETANLVRYEEAYNLSAKVIQVMNEVLQRLIDQTGV